jgi:hypothetical protein
MGGGGHYDYPKHVWSPAGGWMWERAPRAWKRNTGHILFPFSILAFFPMTVSQSSLSRRRCCCNSRRLLNQHVQCFSISRSEFILDYRVYGLTFLSQHRPNPPMRWIPSMLWSKQKVWRWFFQCRFRYRCFAFPMRFFV